MMWLGYTFEEFTIGRINIVQVQWLVEFFALEPNYSSFIERGS